MGSRGLSVTDPTPAPEIVNWGGKPALMVRRYGGQPVSQRRVSQRPVSQRPVSQRPVPQHDLSQRPVSQRQVSQPTAQQPEWRPEPQLEPEPLEPEPWLQSRPRPQPESRARLRDLDPLPDENLWIVEDLFTPEKTHRPRGLPRLLASVLAVTVVLDLGALVVRSAGTNRSPSPASTALQAFSPTSLAPPMSGPALTSSTTAASTTTVARKVAVAHTTKPTAKGATGSAQLPTSGTWACIIQHESGGNPRAVNASSGAGGLFQFLPSSWVLYGGTGRPQDASVAEQWRIAQNAYARSGFTPWRGDGCV